MQGIFLLPEAIEISLKWILDLIEVDFREHLWLGNFPMLILAFSETSRSLVYIALLAMQP